MLRPACLLPAARLAPPHRLLTPRSGTEVSLHCLGSATRRTDAYRDGTLTRWTSAACSNTPSPSRVQSCFCFVTHHAGDSDVAALGHRDAPRNHLVVRGQPQRHRHPLRGLSCARRSRVHPGDDAAGVCRQHRITGLAALHAGLRLGLAELGLRCLQCSPRGDARVANCTSCHRGQSAA